VRGFLLAAVVAVAGVAGLLIYQGSRPDRSGVHQRMAEPEPPTVAGAPRSPPALPDLAAAAHSEPYTAKTQILLARFVRTAPQRGPEKVPLILALLMAGDDRSLRPRWTYTDGHPDGFPSLRSAYIEALRAIPGPEATRALAAVLKLTQVREEAYLLGLALEERGESGWAPTLLRHAFAKTPARLTELATTERIIKLAAHADPIGTSETLLARTADIDGALKWGIEAMPASHATNTTERALRMAEVPFRAKVIAVRALCGRAEVAGLIALSDMAARGELKGRIGLETAYAMVETPRFRLDALAYRRATADRSASGAARARARFDERERAVRRFCLEALNLDLATTNDPRGKALQRQLDAHRKALGE